MPVYADSDNRPVPTLNNEVLVEVENLSRLYGGTAAVADMNFVMRRGEVLGFLGPNGAGKTTTMHMLSGNLAPSRGRVLIGGHDMRDAPRAAKQRIGYLPEHPPLYRELTVDAYLAYCAALHRVPKIHHAETCATAKARCGLSAVGKRAIGNLSKGYQQRVGLAQAILHNPDVIILDEPTVGLDPIQIREIRTLIRELGRDHGVILSTHILSEVQATCDRVQIINKGRLVLNENIDDLDRRMQSSVLVVAFRNAPDITRIERLPGVTAVVATEALRLRIFYEPNQDPTEDLMRLSTDQAWGLREINPERLSLENLFVELTGDTETRAS